MAVYQQQPFCKPVSDIFNVMYLLL